MSSVALHMMSPLSCGLFNRAILQSTGATPRWGFITREEALKRSVRLTKELKCPYNRYRIFIPTFSYYLKLENCDIAFMLCLSF